MSKRLIVLALIALTVCFVSAAYAEVQNVKVGGDLTVVGVARNNVSLRKASSGATTDASAAASIARVKIEANLTDNVDVTFRLLNERIWSSSSESTTNGNGTGVDIDLAYVTFKDFLKDTIGVPLTLKLGRQDIKIGSGLLLADPDTNQRTTAGNFANSGTIVNGIGDLSARKAFDGAVAVMDFNPLTVTAGAVKVTEGSVTDGTNDDVNAYVLSGAYNLGVMNSTIELTYLMEDSNKKSTSTAALNPGDINVYDARFVATPIENLGVEAEYAYMTNKQASVRADRKLISDSAFRLNGMYTFVNTSMTPSFGLDYTRLSENWQPLFEDQSPASIVNVLFANTNVQAFGATLGAKPTSDLSAKLRFAYLRLVKAGATSLTSNGTGLTYTMDGTKKSLGNEVDLDLAYDYTSDVQFGLNLGYFKPGKAFARDYRGACSQVIGSMKVSF